MAEKVSPIAPLKVYVLWHEKFRKGSDYAKKIYYEFCRKQEDYVGESIGIPVYFENQPSVDLDSAIKNFDHVVFVLLVDSNMSGDLRWKSFAEQIVDYAITNEEVAFFPVAVNSNEVIKFFSKKVAEYNYIRLKAEHVNEAVTASNGFENKSCALLFELAHELARLLYVNESCNNAAIKVFISHARADGSEYAKDFNRFIADTPLVSFIDIYDIARGKRFEDEIDKNIDGSALMIIYTDSYSSREWCQHEVLYAKWKGRPILLIDALNEGELRRFPYLANVRTIHLGHGIANTEKKRKVLYAIILESLKIKFTQLYLQYLVNLYDLDKDVCIFDYPPELATLLMANCRDNKTKCVLYPEPPLNRNEMMLIKKFSPEIDFITPTFICGLKFGNQDLKLSNLNIGISVSETENEAQGAKTNLHLSMFFIELCRYLLVMDANLVFGGDINYKKQPNFVNILRNLIANYCSDSYKTGRILNLYLPENIIDNTTKLQCQSNIVYEEAKMKSSYSGESEKLSEFRKILNERCGVRIALGGKITNNSDKISGVTEEVYLALKSKKPVYILGAYGGAAEQIIKCFEGNTEVPILEDVAKFFNECGYAGLNNGLTKEENKKLHYSIDVAESISLILKGLSKVWGDAR